MGIGRFKCDMNGKMEWKWEWDSGIGSGAGIERWKRSGMKRWNGNRKINVN